MRYQGRTWTTGLFRNARKGGLYLSDIANINSGRYILVSRVTYFDVIKEGNVEARESRNYTAFDGYPDLYDFLYEREPYEREFHETTIENAKQKPRFDIDIKYKDYKTFLKDHNVEMPFIEFSEKLKDVVIDSSIRVAKALGIELEIDKDFMIFTSHRVMKRSYHIILNRYYHMNSRQAKEFYLACGRVCQDRIERAAYDLFVDGSVYNPNANLRILWCVKYDGDDPVPKVYSEEFTFLGKTYKHVIKTKSYDIKPNNIDTTAFKKLNIFANSLITFTDNATQLPLIPISESRRLRENVEMTDETYQECINKIEAWDDEKVFEIEGESEGIIRLRRKAPSHCKICNRVHEAHPAYCYLNDADLYWHCGRAEGKSGIVIANLQTVCGSTAERLKDLHKRGIVSSLDTKIQEREVDDDQDDAITVSIGSKVVATFEPKESKYKTRPRAEIKRLEVEPRTEPILFFSVKEDVKETIKVEEKPKSLIKRPKVVKLETPVVVTKTKVQRLRGL